MSKSTIRGAIGFLLAAGDEYPELEVALPPRRHPFKPVRAVASPWTDWAWIA
jgi:hypothetical protein